MSRKRVSAATSAANNKAEAATGEARVAGGREGAAGADHPGDSEDAAARYAALAARVRAAAATPAADRLGQALTPATGRPDAAAPGPGLPADPAALARSAGLTRAALADLLRDHAHMTPAAWLVRERTRAALALLRDTDASVEEIAATTNFASGKDLRKRCIEHLRMTPEDYRSLATARTFALQLPKGYRAAEILAYHGRDPQSPCERVEGHRLWKALLVPEGPIVLEIAFEPMRAVCRLRAAANLAPASVRHIHTIALRMLGLTADVRGFEAAALRDAALAPLVARRRGLRIPLTPTIFDALCWAIMGQQINLAFASALRREILALAGERIDNMLAHPTPERVARIDIADLTSRRFSRSKAEYLLDTARAVAAGDLNVEAITDGSAVFAEHAMTKLRGIGTWTARYVLMRGAGFADCAPVGDVALAAALQKATASVARPGPKEVEALMRPFAPYRSLATFHLWASLRDPA